MLITFRQDTTRALAKWTSLALAAPLGVLSAAALDTHTADAKTPGSTYCYYGTCHRVKTLSEMQDLIGTQSTMMASFYDGCKVDRYNPCGLTSSGEMFHPDRADNAASPIYPDGTKLLVWAPDTKEAAVLRVNNAGPYWGSRTLDVSRAAAERLGFKDRGVGRLDVRVLSAPGRKESTYKHERTYDPVPGALGQFDSLDEAMRDTAALMAVQDIALAVMVPFGGIVLPAARGDILVAAAGGNALAKKAAVQVASVRAPVPAQPVRLAAVYENSERRAKAVRSAPQRLAAAPARESAKAAASARHAAAEIPSRRTPAERAKSITQTVRVASHTPPHAAHATAKVRVAVVTSRKPVFKAAAAQEMDAAGLNSSLATGHGGWSRKVAAVHAPQRKAAVNNRAQRSAAPPLRSASAGPSRSAKRLTSLNAKGSWKVSDAGAWAEPARMQVTGSSASRQKA